MLSKSGQLDWSNANRMLTNTGQVDWSSADRMLTNDVLPPELLHEPHVLVLEARVPVDLRVVQLEARRVLLDLGHRRGIPRQHLERGHPELVLDRAHLVEHRADAREVLLQQDLAWSRKRVGDWFRVS